MSRHLNFPRVCRTCQMTRRLADFVKIKGCRFGRGWECKQCSAAKQKLYKRRPEAKAQQKTYCARPEIRERRRQIQKAYRARPEVQQKMRDYRQRPAVKERHRLRSAAYRQEKAAQT